MQSWFVSVQRELWRGALVDLAYIGNRADDLLLFANYNQARRTTAPARSRCRQRRPIPEFADITYSFNGGKSRYKAFQGKFEWRMGRDSHAPEFADACRKPRTTAPARSRTAGLRQHPGAAELLQPRRAISASARITSRTTTRRASSTTCPFGTGRRCMGNASPLLDALIGGWQVALHQQHLRGRDGDAHLHAGRRVPGVGASSRTSAAPTTIDRTSSARCSCRAISAPCRTGSIAPRSSIPTDPSQPFGNAAAQRVSRTVDRGRPTLRASKRFGMPWRNEQPRVPRGSSSTCSTATNFRAAERQHRSLPAFGTITATLRSADHAVWAEG